MMVKLKLDDERLLGAICVLENYLDGALADYLNGDIDENMTMCLDDSIYVHRMLELARCPFNAMVEDEYERRKRDYDNSRKNL